MDSTSLERVSENRSKRNLNDECTISDHLGCKCIRPWHWLIYNPYSELAREKMWARIHLIPLLQAEEDRDLVRRYLADRAREKELLGAETSPYNSDRYTKLILWNSSGRANFSKQICTTHVRCDTGQAVEGLGSRIIL